MENLKLARYDKVDGKAGGKLEEVWLGAKSHG